MSGLSASGSAVRSGSAVIRSSYKNPVALVLGRTPAIRELSAYENVDQHSEQSTRHHKSPGVEEVARVDLVLELAHERPIAAWLAPDIELALPRRRAADDDDAPVPSRRTAAQIGQDSGS